MKFVDEYRDGTLAKAVADRIRKESCTPVRLMEICGTHTMAVFRHGLRSLLPETVELVSGPGCPVCVTAIEDIDRAMKLTEFPDVTVATFGDMLRVPGSASSLMRKKAQGGDVRVVYSTVDALRIAEKNPERQVVFLGVGFETTAPTVAAALKTARVQDRSNFSVLSAHKLLPPAMTALLSDGKLGIDGFMCPGHVTTVIGASAYDFVSEGSGIPCVVTGFEPLDILQGILMLIRQIETRKARVEIQYRRGATREGNAAALKIIEEVFDPCESLWRGLGPIPESGLSIRKTYAEHDAAARFDLEVPEAREPSGCRCAEVLRGRLRPVDCALFRKKCTPGSPVGPCMVSSEGTCAAYFKYGSF